MDAGGAPVERPVSDRALQRVDVLLSELTELVETARSLPMTSSVMLPREQVLDLLDELREVMPAGLAESRQVLRRRDELLEAAQRRVAAVLAEARTQADYVLAAAAAERERLAGTTEVARAAREHADRTLADLAAVLQRAQLDAERARAALRAEG